MTTMIIVMTVLFIVRQELKAAVDKNSEKE
jgi:hypothetical protein